MPKSKRDQKVSLTKTTKKGLQAKQQLVEDIKDCLGKYKNVFVFTTPNMRNTQLKSLRGDWKNDSRFFFGKNKVMTLGLGRKKSEEVEKDTHLVSKFVKGQCGLLFTNKSQEEVVEYFDNFVAHDYPRSGFIATKTVTLPEGPLPDFSHSMEPQLRQLGLPTSLQRGVVTLTQEHPVCKEGKPLTPEQARILKLLGNQMAEFKVILLCAWSKDGFVSYVKDKNKLNTTTKASINDEVESMDQN
ncbi:mRNA turnover protein 4 homolog [Halyomorpha halys]|uniref:mRNA turnover protein 4 homolog n=1 Tax=Halyomorpha halys TaxID=286706 RepID=UPI0006D4E9B5|nr:mRNA turnover protein 4 homolog [Halyomorpha halys]